MYQLQRYLAIFFNLTLDCEHFPISQDTLGIYDF